MLCCTVLCDIVHYCVKLYIVNTTLYAADGTLHNLYSLLAIATIILYVPLKVQRYIPCNKHHFVYITTYTLHTITKTTREPESAALCAPRHLQLGLTGTIA